MFNLKSKHSNSILLSYSHGHGVISVESSSSVRIEA
jgi:hypothetical protein